jgi:hypothetical protein
MPWSRSADEVMALLRLAPFGDHVRFIRARSVDAANLIPREWRIDFAYIDGAHNADAVSADILAWWPRVHRAGILAGHDFDEHHPDVVAVVQDFARRNDLRIQVTRDADTARSWIIDKAQVR